MSTSMETIIQGPDAFFFLHLMQQDSHETIENIHFTQIV